MVGRADLSRALALAIALAGAAAAPVAHLRGPAGPLAREALARPVSASYDSSGAVLEATFPPGGGAEAAALAELSRARRYVRVAQYNIRNERFADKLLDLKRRGVDVRVAIDGKNSENPWNTLDDAMIAAGLDVSKVVNSRSPSAIMHHKFTVVDGEVVMTGSYNWNHTAELANDEHLVVIRSPSVAAVYEEEWEELVGRRPETRNAYAQGERVRAYFCPEDRPDREVEAALRAAKDRVFVACFALTYSPLVRALEDLARAGVRVEVVTEKKQADATDADERIAAAGGRVVVGANRSGAFSAMHQKYAVVDGETVSFGAANWTRTAFRDSNEDVVIARDAALAAAFEANFASLMLRYDPAFDPGRYAVARPRGAVAFVARHGGTAWGDTVLVVGDLPELGGWDPARGLPLRTSDDLFPAWGGAVSLAAGEAFEYKYVTRAASGTVFWEEGANRRAAVPASGLDLSLLDDYRATP